MVVFTSMGGDVAMRGKIGQVDLKVELYTDLNLSAFHGTSNALLLPLLQDLIDIQGMSYTTLNPPSIPLYTIYTIYAIYAINDTCLFLPLNPPTLYDI
jgi:hypothetical protein